MITITSNRMRRIASGAFVAAATAVVALGAPAVGHADPGPGPTMGCETVHWGIFGNDRRQICDGPQQPDGTWQRTRRIYTPATNEPLRCHNDGTNDDDGNIVGGGSLKCTGGYPVPETILNRLSYPVAPNTVLHDEPGWLPPFTDNIM